MSMGYLVDESAPVVWRGLMVMKALQQLLHEVHWDGLDILVLDLPPGTGDTQLTITQQIELSGAVIVSTPQDIALKDAIKGINMFEKMKIPVLGMVQNMSLFTCPGCGTKTHVFGGGEEHGQGGHGIGVERACKKHGIQFLGDVPLHPKICDDADRGKPTVVSEPKSERAEAYRSIAERVGKEIGLF